MSVSQLTGVQLVDFVCSSIPLVLFDNPEIFKYVNTMFLLSPHFCLKIGFICDLSAARNDSWMSRKNSTRTEQIRIQSNLNETMEIRDMGSLSQ